MDDTDKVSLKALFSSRKILNQLAKELKSEKRTFVGLEFDFTKLDKVSQENVLDLILSQFVTEKEGKLILKKNKK